MCPTVGTHPTRRADVLFGLDSALGTDRLTGTAVQTTLRVDGVRIPRGDGIVGALLFARTAGGTGRIDGVGHIIG